MLTHLRRFPIFLYFCFICTGLVIESEQNESGNHQRKGKEADEIGEGRTLGHIVQGGHALVEAFVGGLLDASYNTGNHLGGSFHQRFRPPYYSHQFGRPPPYAPDYLYSDHHYGIGHSSIDEENHRPGFAGTYASRPFTRRRKYNSLHLEEIDKRFPIATDKRLPI